MLTVLITGANRGIGLEFVKQYLLKDNVVIATCRSKKNSNELNDLEQHYGSKLCIIEMDLSDHLSITKGFEKIINSFQCIDILINNAGTNSESEKGLHTLEYNAMLKVFSVNTFAPLILAKHALTLLKKSKNAKIASLFSGLGFIQNQPFNGSDQFSYAASKAALNMAVQYLAADLKSLNITSIGIGPGFVLTDLTKNAIPKPELMPNESVKNMIEIIDKINLSDSGKFIENNESEIKLQ